MATPEGRVKTAIKKYLATVPDCWFYMPVQNGMGVVGIPDIVCCVRGRMVAIECKALGKVTETTPNQERVLNAISKCGGVAIVADSVEAVILQFKLYNVLGARYV